MAFMDLFKPKWDHSNADVRNEAIKPITDQKLLSDIAKNGEYSEIREAAMKKLTNPDLLANIAKYSNDVSIRKKAIERLTNQELLADIAINDENDIVAVVALRKITNHKLLSNIAEKARSYEARKFAKTSLNRILKILTDQSILKDIAENNDNYEVRLAAVRKLTSQEVLSKMAKDEIDGIREEAVRKITSQELLKDIAKNDNYYAVSQAAVRKLTNQELLADVAKNARSIEARSAAVQKLTNHDLLANFLKNDKNYFIRKVALEKLINQNLEKHISESDEDNLLGHASLRKQNKEEILADIAKNELYSGLCRAAAKRLKNYDILLDVAKNAAANEAREIAVEQLNDQSYLAQIAKNDEDDDVRLAAVKNLTDQNILVEIARDDSFDNIRWADYEDSTQAEMARRAKYIRHINLRECAIAKITDHNKLASVIKNGKNGEIRYYALKQYLKIKEPNEKNIELLKEILHTYDEEIVTVEGQTISDILNRKYESIIEKKEQKWNEIDIYGLTPNMQRIRERQEKDDRAELENYKFWQKWLEQEEKKEKDYRRDIRRLASETLDQYKDNTSKILIEEASTIDYIPALGLRFNISKIDNPNYSFECWKAFWDEIDPERIKNSSFFQGDSKLTLSGTENVFCIAIQNPDINIIKLIKNILEKNNKFLNISDEPKFIDSNQILFEPLIEAGKVDKNGELIGNAGESKYIINLRRKEANISQSDFANYPVISRAKPASARTKKLPYFSSLFEEVFKFVENNFTAKEFGRPHDRFCSPEELCDICEQYSDLLTIQIDTFTTEYSTDVLHVKLYSKDKSWDGGLNFYGICKFTSKLALDEYLRGPEHYNLDPPEFYKALPQLLGIKKEFQINFSIFANSTEGINEEKNKIVQNTELWIKFSERFFLLGIDKVIDKKNEYNNIIV